MSRRFLAGLPWGCDRKSAAKSGYATVLRRLRSFGHSTLALGLEDEGGERREGEQEGVRAILSGDLFGVEAAEIADAGASIVCGVGIEDFLVEAADGDADAVIATDDWRGVQDDDEKIFVIPRAAYEGDDAVVAVVAINPFETGPFEINFVESRLLRVEAIQIADEPFDATV